MMILALCFMVLRNVSHAQTGEISYPPSENMDINLFFHDDGEKNVLTENLDLTFVNATSLPFDLSIEAVTDHFRSARFCTDPSWSFLRVLYDAPLDPQAAYAYVDRILMELRKAFNLQINVLERTNILTNETIDVYYHLNGFGYNVSTFQELTKYIPAEGFGKLIDRDMLSLYLQGGFVTGTLSNLFGIYIAHDLIRTEEGYFWNSLVFISRQTAYENEKQVVISLNQLLNHTGPIAPSSERPSEVTVSFQQLQETEKTRLLLTFNRSSPNYSYLNESDTKTYHTNTTTKWVDLIYNLDAQTDDLVITIDVSEIADFSWIFQAIVAISAISAASVLTVILVRRRQRKIALKAQLPNPDDFLRHS